MNIRQAQKITGSYHLDFEETESERGLQLSSLEWLLIHHAAKEQDRRALVSTLPLKSSDRVLDLGCGPGLWIELLKAKLDAGGWVVGLDFDHEFLRYALRKENLSAELPRACFCQGNFQELPFKSESFDAIFFGNGFYYTSHAQNLLKEQVRILRHGGLLMGRHADDSNLIIYPLEADLLLEVLHHAAQELRKRPPSPPFKNAFGRSMHGHFLRAGLDDVQTHTVQKIAPLSGPEKSYIINKMQWYAEVIRGSASTSLLATWLDRFDPKSSSYILDRQDFFFATLEMLSVGVKPWPDQHP